MARMPSRAMAAQPKARRRWLAPLKGLQTSHIQRLYGPITQQREAARVASHPRRAAPGACRPVPDVFHEQQRPSMSNTRGAPSHSPVDQSIRRHYTTARVCCFPEAAVAGRTPSPLLRGGSGPPIGHPPHHEPRRPLKAVSQGCLVYQYQLQTAVQCEGIGAYAWWECPLHHT